MRTLVLLIMALGMSHAFANSAPTDYVSVHPDPQAQEQVTQKQISASQFFAQFEQLRQWLDDDRAQMPEDNTPNEAHYWACVRINQLATLFQNNRAHQSAFNRQYPDMDFQTLVNYWQQDIHNEREACYQSEIAYSDRP